MTAPAVPQAIVTLSHALQKTGEWFTGEFDPEALLNAIKEKFGATATEITKPQLKEVFMGLGYDKEKVEEVPEEEGGGGEGEGEEGAEKPPKPEPKKEISMNAEATFDLVQASRDPKQLPSTASNPSEAIELTYLLPTLFLAKSGFGEPALRFALKIADITDGANGLKEPQVWRALVRCANTNFDGVSRNHLRKAWRNAEKVPLPGQDGEGEEGGEGEGEAPPEGEAPAEGGEGEGGEGGAAAAPKEKPPKPVYGPEDTKVVIDSFVEKLTEDEKLVSLVLKELPIPEPPKEPVPEEEAAAGEGAEGEEAAQE